MNESGHFIYRFEVSYEVLSGVCKFFIKFEKYHN